MRDGALPVLGATAVVAVVAACIMHARRRRCRRLGPSLIVLDGGCGLELKRRKTEQIGPQPVAYDLTLFSTAALLETPNAIVALHRDYIRAGCTAITTASFAVTRFYLSKVGQEGRLAELAQRSVALARQAVREEHLVVGFEHGERGEPTRGGDLGSLAVAAVPGDGSHAKVPLDDGDAFGRGPHRGIVPRENRKAIRVGRRMSSGGKFETSASLSS